MTLPLWAIRGLVVAVCLVLWFWSQALIAKRGFPAAGIGDRILDWTAPLHAYLVQHPSLANRLLIATSLLIDLLGIFLLLRGMLGPSFRPILGLLIIFFLRQVCQGLCALPCPDGMIWRDPGFPSILVTYATAADLFFSGHTAIAVYGCIELGLWGGTAAAVAGVAITAIEISAVLVLRAHYTMDVFAGAVTAMWVAAVASSLATPVDRLLARLAG